MQLGPDGPPGLARRAAVASLRLVPRIAVDVMLKPGILDPQGQAIAGALPRLGFAGVRSVRQGKHFEIDIDDESPTTVLETVEKIAETLLANPVIEDYEIRTIPG